MNRQKVSWIVTLGSVRAVAAKLLHVLLLLLIWMSKQFTWTIRPRQESRNQAILTCVSQKYILEEGQFLAEQLDALLQSLVLLPQLGDPLVGFLSPFPGLLPRLLDGLVVAGALSQVVGVLGTLDVPARAILPRTHVGQCDG
jgi:hypothetical protein